jgi:hypothetical protein
MAAAKASRDGANAAKRPRAYRMVRVIRDSFSMPTADYALIAALKQRCLRLGLAMKKSELLRAGLTTLSQLPDESLLRVAMAVESVKTGRPPGKAKSRKKHKARKTHRAKHG